MANILIDNEFYISYLFINELSIVAITIIMHFIFCKIVFVL